MKLTRFLAILLLLGGISHVSATTNSATTGSFADVSLAVSKSQLGDTVSIPPGTNIWTTTLQLTGITLAGSGQNSTVIIDETPPTGNGTALIQMNTTTTMTRVTQLQLRVGKTNSLPFQNYNGSIIIWGTSPFFRVDHCLFNYLTSKPIHVGAGENGLIDHCTFLCSNTANAIEVYGPAYGDVSWATPYVTGTSNAVYMEDNYIYSANSFCAADMSGGARAVFRHNTLVGSFFNTHGTETSERYRSARFVEVYNNSFTWGGGQQYNNFYTTCDIRGGGAVIFSNTAVGYYGISSINYYRATDNDQNFIPFFGATGERAWDSNGPVILSGTATVSSNALVVAGANWTANQWVGCTVYNQNTALMGIVTGNNVNTMTFQASRSSWLQVKFSPGDPFEIHKIYPMIDQPGMGTGDLLSPTNGNPAPIYLNETPDPIYIWGNSLQVMYQSLTSIGATGWSAYPNVQPNRDYFNNVARPGYVSFVYPHPWVTLMDGSNTNAVVPPPTNTNAVPPVMSPPTNLKAQGL